MECWNACTDEKGAGNAAGYCNKCNSVNGPYGQRGACCKFNADGDPQECKNVPESSFYYHGYHMCVLVPGKKLNTFMTSYHFAVLN